MGAKHRARRMMLSIGLPEDTLPGSARVTMTGQCGVLVEGHRGVIELGTARIRLRTGQGVLSVLGEKLALWELSMDAALIVGERVEGVTYAKA